MTHKNYLKSKRYSATTIKTHLNKIRHFEAYLESNSIQAENITYNQVIGYIQAQKATNTSKSLNHSISIIKTYLDYQVAMGVITENPIDKESLHVRGEKRQTLYRLLKKEVLLELYHTFYDEKDTTLRVLTKLARQRDKLVVGLLCFQGVTTTDLKLIKTEDVNLERGIIYIPSSRKSNSRTLNLKGFQVLEFQNYLIQVRERLRELKQQESTEIFIEGNINNIMANILKRLKGVHSDITSTQQIRASVIGLWLKQYSLRKVQVMVGHRFISSTEAYLQNDLEDLHKVVDSLHPLR